MSIYPVLGYRKAERSYETYREVCEKRARFNKRIDILGKTLFLVFILLGLTPFLIALIAEFGGK